MEHPTHFTLIRHVLTVSVRAAMRNAVTAILLLPILFFMPTEGFAMSLVDLCNGLQKPRLKAGTWEFRYCEVRNRYLDFLAMGASEAVIIEGMIINDQRDMCLSRILSGQKIPPTKAHSLKEGLDKLRTTTLPRLIEHLGQTKGTKEYKFKIRDLLTAFEILQYSSIQCDKEAVRAYTTRWPELLK